MKRSLLALFVLVLAACAAPRPERLGVRNGALRECPSSPNCVSSAAADEPHAIAPLRLVVAPSEAWPQLEAVIAALPRTRITRRGLGYLHAEQTSAVMRYVDDLEFVLVARPGEPARLAVRSASRIGYGDMGANRARVAAIRAELVRRGVVLAD